MSIPEIKIFEDAQPKLTKKQKRLLRQQNATQNTGLKIKTIKPLTENQQKTFEIYDSDRNLLLIGSPGTGKSFLSLYLSLDEILEPNSIYKKLIIFRSAVEGRKIGFLPGKASDKMAVYEAPYKKICNDLFGRGDAYDVLKQKNILEFESTSFLRGHTYNDSVMFIDECQNMSDQELHTIITRYGKNCKIIFAGDTGQIDLISRIETSGLYKFKQILDNMSSFATVTFNPADIVRDDLVKEYIIIRLKLEENGLI